MDYDDTNRGVLFFEENKKSDNHPDLTGKLNVEGKDYRIASWQKTSKTGSKFYSLAISEPREPGKEQSGYEQARSKAEEIKARQQDEALGKKVSEAIDDDTPIDLSDIPF